MGAEARGDTSTAIQGVKLTVMLAAASHALCSLACGACETARHPPQTADAMSGHTRGNGKG